MSSTELKRFKDYFEYAYCKKMLDSEFEKYDIDERIRRIASDYFQGKTPGSAGPIPSLENLKERETWTSRWDFEEWFGRPRPDGLRMRAIIEHIDEALRKTKAGTVTGSYKQQMFFQQRKVEQDFRERQKKVIANDPLAEGLFDERQAFYIKQKPKIKSVSTRQLLINEK